MRPAQLEVDGAELVATVDVSLFLLDCIPLDMRNAREVAPLVDAIHEAGAALQMSIARALAEESLPLATLADVLEELSCRLERLNATRSGLERGLG